MGGRFFEAGHLLTFPTFRVGAYSRLGKYGTWFRNCSADKMV